MFSSSNQRVENQTLIRGFDHLDHGLSVAIRLTCIFTAHLIRIALISFPQYPTLDTLEVALPAGNTAVCSTNNFLRLRRLLQIS